MELRYADLKRQKPLATGSARSVYIHGSDVAKCSRTTYYARGHAQNEAEYDIFRYEDGCSILCPVIDITPNNQVITMKRAQRITVTYELDPEAKPFTKELKRKLKFLAEEFAKDRDDYGLPKKVPKPTEKHTPWQREVLESDWFMDICKLVFDHELLPGDIVRPSSWGYYDGRFVLMDYGCTKEVYRLYYQYNPF